MVGKTLGHYEIIESLGVGGMGEVYRARDTTLDRDVAVKVLPEELATDPDRLARLEQEARLLASLNHPSIATIHGLEQHGDTRFVVLELIEGRSLEELLAGGPLAAGEALELARQIAAALEAAHGAGIVHRDLKPANVLVTPDGRAKVLDFGIAKTTSVDPDLSLTSGATRLTVTGVIVGTPAYMSPEQVRGQDVDKRSDNWAFGCLLYEMLAARSPFARETLADTFVAIMEQEPDWDIVTERAPAGIAQLLERCLRKDPRYRLRDIGDAWVMIDETLSGATGSAVSPASVPRHAATTGGTDGIRWTLAAPAMLAIALMAAFATWLSTGADDVPGTGIKRLAARLPSGVISHSLAVSPDGRYLVVEGVRYVDGVAQPRQLYLRPLDRDAWTPLAQTVGGGRPFFSPDSRWIGFSHAAGLSKVSVTGEGPIRLCTDCADEWTDGTWAPAGDALVFDYRFALYRVSSAGGDPELLAEPDEERRETAYARVHVLPDGESALVEVYHEGPQGSIGVMDLSSGRMTIVVDEGRSPGFSSTGHILFKRQQALWAVPYDAVARRVTGGPAPVAEELGQYALSHEGTLAAAPPLVSTDPRQRRLVWRDTDGNFTPASEDMRAYHRVAIAPDGRRIAVTIDEANTSNVWILDTETDVLEPVTFDGGDHPVWSPEGDWLAYRGAHERGNAIYRIFPGLSNSAPEPLLISSNPVAPSGVSPDALTLVFVESRQDTERDIMALPLGEPPGTPYELIATPRDEVSPRLSPDGRWIAYMSSPRPSVWETRVAAFPGPGQDVQVSGSGGEGPVWSREGDRLLFASSDWSRLLVADVASVPELEIGPPRPLVDLGPRMQFVATTARRFDVSVDGRRLLLVEQLPDYSRIGELTVVVNWFEELQERLTSGR